MARPTQPEPRRSRSPRIVVTLLCSLLATVTFALAEQRLVMWQ
jgi:hypothetical protein